MGEGSYFGEIGLLKKAKRIATVRAKTNVEVMAMSHDTFERWLNDSQISRQEIDAVMEERLMLIGDLQLVDGVVPGQENDDTAVPTAANILEAATPATAPNPSSRRTPGSSPSTNITTKGTHFISLPATDLTTGLKLKNTHKDRLFVELNYTGNPAKAPEARRDAFNIKRDWYTADGKELGVNEKARPLKVGETLIIRLNVKTKGRYANGLVVDYIPAGVEIENTNIVQGEQNTVEIAKVDMRQAMQDTRIKHVEFRDDRFVVAARLEGEMNFFYRVRVVTPGKFVMPPTYAEDMYQPMVYGLAGGGEVVVVGDTK